MKIRFTTSNIGNGVMFSLMANDVEASLFVAPDEEGKTILSGGFHYQRNKHEVDQ